ncbi:hypothetical protein DPMN_033890 [Dreissena polymorpha]|uniref:Uncharacterized protein n=1 Tax=Dreissena polymorpha TaxID=45954 RepID=A0A9D4M7H6_DREPO|nr:hypothetical protein DPMN_033890 [Dreissena polymorpha]
MLGGVRDVAPSIYLDILKIVPEPTMTNQAPLSLMNRLKKPIELSVSQSIRVRHAAFYMWFLKKPVGGLDTDSSDSSHPVGLKSPQESASTDSSHPGDMNRLESPSRVTSSHFRSKLTQ